MIFDYLFGSTQQAQQGTILDRALYSLLNNDAPVISQDGFDYVSEGYLSSSAVYECVDMIVKKIVSYPVLIYRIKDENKYKSYKNLIKSENPSDRAKALLLKEQAVEEVDQPRIRKLLDNPNKTQTWNDFVSLLATLYLVDGNAFVYGNGADIKNKKWTEITALPFTSKEMTIVSGGMLEPVKGYNANWVDGAMIFTNPNQIAHFKTVNPKFSLTGSQMYGISPLKAYVMKLVRDRLGNEQANKLLKNGGALGMLTPKNKEDALGTDQRKQLNDSIRKSLGSNAPHDRIMGGSISMDWLQIGLPSTELQILDLLKTTDESIYRAYHVPLTYVSTDASSYNNITTSGKQLVYNAVAPPCDYISEKLTRFICEAYNSDKERYEIKIDYMSAPELSADMKEVADWLDKSDDLTPNEKREVKGFGKSQDPLMDKVYMNKNKAPIEFINSPQSASVPFQSPQ